MVVVENPPGRLLHSWETLRSGSSYRGFASGLDESSRRVLERERAELPVMRAKRTLVNNVYSNTWQVPLDGHARSRR